jgi:hypothetical protein
MTTNMSFVGLLPAPRPGILGSAPEANLGATKIAAFKKTIGDIHMTAKFLKRKVALLTLTALTLFCAGPAYAEEEEDGELLPER